jgi:glycerol transport system ATP-binding protein
MTLSLADIHIEQQGVTHLDHVTLEFEPGRLTTVLGRTLAGKTTLLRSIAGLQEPNGGSITLDGAPFSTLPAWERDVALVYQQFINYPHLSVFDNVAFPLRSKGVAPVAIKARSDEVIAKVGLSAVAQRRPGALSGGQQQRVALARALVRRAKVLLLDEPLVNLDYKLREQLRDEFRSLLSGGDRTVVVYTTTEPAEAMMLGDWLIVMHEGRVLQSGRPAEVFERPASIGVAMIINDPPMTIVDGELDGEVLAIAGGVRSARPQHLYGLPSGAYRFGIRANAIRLDHSGQPNGTISFAEVSGSETFVHFDAAFGAAVMQVEGVHSMAIGDKVSVRLPSEEFFCFARDDGRLLAAPGLGAR